MKIKRLLKETLVDRLLGTFSGRIVEVQLVRDKFPLKPGLHFKGCIDGSSFNSNYLPPLYRITLEKMTGQRMKYLNMTNHPLEIGDYCRIPVS